MCFQFVNILNSKKAKLRELRDRHSSQKVTGKLPKEEDDSSEDTVPYRSGSESSDSMQHSDEKSDDFGETSKDTSPSKPRARKRNTRN